MWFERFLQDKQRNGAMSPFRKRFWILFFIRAEQGCKNRWIKKLCALLKKVASGGMCCEIPAVSLEGGGIRFPHLQGIVINEEARIGANVTIFHQVTLGIADKQGKIGAPVICDDVTIGAGAKVLGPVQVGQGAYIGANAVVTKNVPPGAIVVGANRLVN